jgi:hypothetical protein
MQRGDDKLTILFYSILFYLYTAPPSTFPTSPTFHPLFQYPPFILLADTHPSPSFQHTNILFSKPIPPSIIYFQHLHLLLKHLCLHPPFQHLPLISLSTPLNSSVLQYLSLPPHCKIHPLAFPRHSYLQTLFQNSPSNLSSNAPPYLFASTLRN